MTATDRWLSAHDVAVHIAKTISFDVSEQAMQNWRDVVAEHGIELTRASGVFTVDLENGQHFVVRVEEPAVGGVHPDPAPLGEWVKLPCDFRGEIERAVPDGYPKTRIGAAVANLLWSWRAEPCGEAKS